MSKADAPPSLPAKTPARDPGAEIRPLTSLRAFAALLVVLFHFGRPYSSTHDDALAAVFSSGYIGVTIFFVLSGFLITLRYMDALRMGQFSLRAYFVKRVARIYPLYFVMLLSVFAFVPTTVAWPHLLLAQGYFNDLVLTGVPTAWSLTVEEAFYALLPLILILHFRSRLPLIVTLLIWSSGLLAIGHALVLLQIPTYGFMANDAQMLSNTIGGQFPMFAVGMGCAFLYRWRTEWPSGLALISLIGLLGTMVMMAHTIEPLTSVLGYVCGAWTGGIVLGLTAPGGLSYILSHRLFVYLGRISYALYLVQLTPIGQALAFGANFAAQIITLEGLSALFYEFVEHPGQRLVLRLGLGVPPTQDSPHPPTPSP